jgi:uncharacterized protein (TIGR03000 family)
MRRSPLVLASFLVGLYLFVPLALVHGQQPAAPAKPANLKILMPEADAQLLIQNQPTQNRGLERTFVSPPLKAGQKYVYTVTAKWEPNNYTKITRTRKIDIEAGQEVVADLRKADEKSPDDIVIRFVPTPEAVVEAMCKLGQVGKGDVVYDLGCGDGRIVVTAVAKFGAKRGVGVDLDPKRIQESKATAKQAKVEDKVEFRQGDVLKIDDLSDASVVMLYMGDELNLALRPILKKKLRPGSRVVSHRFTMGDWKPDKTITLQVDGEDYLVHLWTVGEGKR